jgi:elongator complex protein 3
MENTELIIENLLKIKAKDAEDLSLAKRKIAKAKKISCPSNIALLKAYHNLVAKKSIKASPKLEQLLRTRPVRSLSGVVNVSVLTKPYECPGNCLYCPTEKGIPRSYLSGEPAVERAKRLKFDPYIQTQKRLEVLDISGHPTEKVELRVIGATWSHYPLKYKIWFCKKCFDACNGTRDASDDKKLSIEELWKRLTLAQKKNEKSKYRIVAMSFETRPDHITIKEEEQMKRLGATKVELGIQSVYEDVLKKNLRGHGLKETIEATKILKNAAFKVSYQVMLNLYGANPKTDLKMFKELFLNPDFKPDCLKIYPCALVKEAALYKKYLKGEYKPYSEKILIGLIKEIKKIVPRYVRIERIIRDIPSPLIVAGGSKISNLRQMIESDMKKENWQCQCIRCREIRDRTPHFAKASRGTKEKAYFFRDDYEASNGKEIFLTFENKAKTNLYSMLRLRVLLKGETIQELKDCALIRELHTYGQAALISEGSEVQHKGLGKKLINEAEKIAKKEFGFKKIAVISGVGVRDYYRKLGYKLSGGYMIKPLI